MSTDEVATRDDVLRMKEALIMCLQQAIIRYDTIRANSHETKDLEN
ncbi:hypothetical protein KA093_02400 [Candidatus Saccharibacteria bacterium]|nr:hypothetical protein [Candidatus Saccharibacteria bacterium]